MSGYPADDVADAQEGWKADPIKSSAFVTTTDNWLVFFLGWSLQIGAFRVFAYAVAFAAIGRHSAREVSKGRAHGMRASN
jgi:hypothetical protein